MSKLDNDINKVKLIIKNIGDKLKGFGMINSIIPKFLLEDEALIELKDMGVEFEEGHVIVGKCKVNCIKVYNLNETQVFDKLEKKSILEASVSDKVSDAELRTYSSRNMAVIFSRIRQVANIKDNDLRCAAVCSILAAVNALASIDPRQAGRFLPMIRGIN